VCSYSWITHVVDVFWYSDQILHDAFAPSTWSNWALVVVGIGAIVAALLTLKKIEEQTVATRDAAVATQKSVELQKTLKLQWLVLENWSITGEDSQSVAETIIGLYFSVVNPTDMPLDLKHVEIFAEGGTKVSSPNKPLAPSKFHTAFFEIKLSRRETSLYFENSLRLHIFGNLTFRDRFGDRRNQIFGQVCSGGVNGFRYTEFEGWLSPEEEDEER